MQTIVTHRIAPLVRDSDPHLCVVSEHRAREAQASIRVDGSNRASARLWAILRPGAPPPITNLLSPQGSYSSVPQGKNRRRRSPAALQRDKGEGRDQYFR